MKEHAYFVYIVANATRQLYTGFTNSMRVRMIQHKRKDHDDGFTTHWSSCHLVYFEKTEDVHRAIARENQIKRWRREKKIWLIESKNPNWHDLCEEWGEKIEAKALPLDSAQAFCMAASNSSMSDCHAAARGSVFMIDVRSLRHRR